jgi:hypothetical protein
MGTVSVLWAPCPWLFAVGSAMTPRAALGARCVHDLEVQNAREIPERRRLLRRFEPGGLPIKRSDLLESRLYQSLYHGEDHTR